MIVSLVASPVAAIEQFEGSLHFNRDMGMS